MRALYAVALALGLSNAQPLGLGLSDELLRKGGIVFCDAADFLRPHGVDLAHEFIERQGVGEWRVAVQLAQFEQAITREHHLVMTPVAPCV